MRSRPSREFGGAKPNNQNKPSAGWHGGSVGGHPLKLVGIGCANDTADSAIKETKRLMEQLGADMMIGPLSGDESVAIANYAKQHPTKTFVNGTAGAWDTTAAVKAPNFFRFNGSGVQWQAGIGSIAVKKDHWKKAAIIMDDYSFGYASGAGFIADFCAAGGTITKRVFPPLNTTDYSSFVQQLPAPDKVDGYFWAIGGTGTVPSIKAFENLYGTLKGSQIIGNLFFFSSGADKTIGPHLNGAYVGGFGTAPDLKGAKVTKYKKILDKWFNKYPPLAGKASDHAADGFTFNYYVNTWALMKAPERGQGQHLRRAEGAAEHPPQGGSSRRGLRQALPRQEQPGSAAAVLVPHGRLGTGRDRGRDGAEGQAVRRRDVRRLGRQAAEPDVPAVCSQEAPVDRQGRSGRQRGRQGVVAQAATPLPSAAPALLLRGVGRRFGGLHAVQNVDLEIRPGERRGILGPNGAGKTTLFNVIAGDFPATSGTIAILGVDMTYEPARARAKVGLARTYQQSRLFNGLSVEDNIYLAIVGVEGGRLRPVRAGRDGDLRDRAREAARRVAIDHKLPVLVGDLSHGEHRQVALGMALAADPKILMLDEPASGLSRGERGLLTDLLLALDASITLLLIEHDMDVALRIAERVTMMHDGRVIVEGTPDEIRGNQLVHDLYLGNAHHLVEEHG